jgi:hypothetical protein
MLAADFRAVHHEHGETYRWFKALEATNYDPSDNTYTRGASGVEKGHKFVEQTVPTAARILVWDSTSGMQDEADTGTLPEGASWCSVMPDETYFGYMDEVILTQRAAVKRVVMTRATGTVYDALPRTPAVALVDVRQSSTVYAPTTHYVLSNDRIQWVGATKPADGTKYAVEFTYSPTYTFIGDGASVKLPRPDVTGVLMPLRGMLTLRSLENG